MCADLDLRFVRGCFPAFAEPLTAQTAFLENAGGSYVAAAVVDKLAHFYRANKAQPYGYHAVLRAAGEQMDAGRQSVADLLGVAPERITLGPSTTQNLNTLALACSEWLGAGDQIIASAQDHEANIGAWVRLCERTGAELVFWEVHPQSGELDLAELRKILTPRVKILCMTHSSNILGSVNPVDEVIAMCRQTGTYSIIDGVSFAPHQIPNLPEMAPDAYCFSTYKTYATHLGVLYTAPQFNASLTPQCHYFNAEYPSKRLDAAGPDHAAIAALSGLGDYFGASFAHHFGSERANNNAAKPSLHQQTLRVSNLMHAHENALCAQLLDAIRALPLRVIGRTEMVGREANVALVSDRHSSAHLSAHLAKHGVAAGYGNFYAPRLLKRVGVRDTRDGVLRLSFAHYNSAEDVSRCVKALESLF